MSILDKIALRHLTGKNDLLLNSIADKDAALKQAGYVSIETMQDLMQRVYNAGLNTRMENWAQIGASIDQDILFHKEVVTERTRDITKNNDYGKRVIRLEEQNVPGPHGYVFQSMVLEDDGKTPDDKANNIIENAWEEFCQPEYCTMSGTLHMIEVMWLEAVCRKRDGEFVAREITGPKVNKFGYSLEILDMLDLDVHYNVDKFPDSGNRIVMGVEIDSWRRPVAYHFKKDDGSIYSRQTIGFAGKHTRVPADQIIHVFHREFPKQTRGMTDFTTSLLRMKKMDGFEEYSLDNAKAAAATFAAWEDIPNSDPTKKYQGDGKSTAGDPIIEMMPGVILHAPSGKKLASIDPNYPHEQHEPFLRTQLRGIAAGQGPAYHSLANDLTQTNYATLKAGRLDEQDYYMCNQTLDLTKFVKRVFKNWLKMALLSGAIDLPYDMEKYHKPVFQPRVWKNLEPLKELQADILAHEKGYTTRTDNIKKRGRNINDVNAELVKEAKMEEELAKQGVKIGVTKETSNINSQNNDDSQDDNNNDNSGGQKTYSPIKRVS